MKVPTIFLLAVSLACSAPKQGLEDLPDSAPQEIPDATVSEEGSGLPSVKPKGYAALRFSVDDSANKTYKDGQMKFTGSFSWNSKDNTIVYAASWLPEEGPYPPLYDDGPWSQGGHEPEGSKARDHIFECEVWYKAEKDTTFEYGLLNEFDRWIWIGPNGVVHVPAGSEETFLLKGLTIPKFGDVDLKITLDITSLHQDFKDIMPYDPATGSGYRIYLKSSANSWTPVELLDDGERGDDKPNDGIFTYVQSENLGPHDGLLYQGQHAQFVFVFAMEGVDPDDGLEYKVENACATEGVKAFLKTSEGFEPVDIFLERDSRGKVFNTTVIVGGGLPWCLTTDDCYGGTPCIDGECRPSGEVSKPTIVSVSPTSGPSEGGTEVTILGTNFAPSAKVFFGGLEAKFVSVQSPTSCVAITPPHEPGPVDVTLRNPDGGEATLKGAFTYLAPGEAPVISGISPDFGPSLGGTEVAVTGQNFAPEATVELGGAEVAKTSITPTTITFVTPKHPVGEVDLCVTNPSGQKACLQKAFAYIPFGTPVLDGRVGPDWDETWLVAENPLQSDWGPNVLTRLYAAYDDTYFYLGIVGTCEAQNAIVGYVDHDFGTGTGYAQMALLGDSVGALDDAISSGLSVTVPGFGADLAFGTKGMAQAYGFAGAQEAPPECDQAGWRWLRDPNDFAWVLSGGEVMTNLDEGSIETWIPLQALFSDGVSAEGGEMIAVVVRLFNHDGTYTSNQGLPAAGPQWAQGDVALIPFRTGAK